MQSNLSAFMVYASVRTAVLEHQMKCTSQLYLHHQKVGGSDSEDDEAGEDSSKDSLPRIPKVGLIKKTFIDFFVHFFMEFLHSGTKYF